MTDTSFVTISEAIKGQYDIWIGTADREACWATVTLHMDYPFSYN